MYFLICIYLYIKLCVCVCVCVCVYTDTYLSLNYMDLVLTSALWE